MLVFFPEHQVVLHIKFYMQILMQKIRHGNLYVRILKTNVSNQLTSH